MLASSAPPKVPVPFADTGGRNAIPATSQIGITPGAASLPDGFPPLTRTPLAAGGVPPNGQDMNGILWLVSAWARWSAAGGPITYDGAFATAIGGYPAGSRVAVTGSPGAYWTSTVDNNTTDPNAGGAGWIQAFPGMATTGRSLGTSGWMLFPGNLLAQWGATPSLAANAGASVTYPITFPNALYVVLPVGGATSPGVGFVGVDNGSGNRSSFGIWTGSGGALPGHFIALGK